jgi:Uma2 family endonuclease
MHRRVCYGDHIAGSPHASWQQAILLWFLQQAREGNIRVLPSLRVQLNPTNLRVPDVTVFDRDYPIEQILTRPPIAVFQVLSPEDTMPRMLRKLREYEQMGIPNIFVLDTTGPLFYQYRHGSLDKDHRPIRPLANSRCSIDWPRLQELLD